jgi:hypothetical protein
MGFDLSVLITAFAAAAVLAAMMRWAFRPSRPRTGRPDHGPDADLGLLVPVLSSASRTAAIRAKNVLSEQGIRCSLSRLQFDQYDVLVFRPDQERAIELLSR